MKDLLNQRNILTSTLNNINIIDDFVTYARTKRQLDSLEETIKSQKQDFVSNLNRIENKMNNLIRIISYVISIFLSWKFFKISVYHSNKTILKWPLSILLSFPLSSENDIGFPFWLTSCHIVLNSMSRFVKKYIK